MPEHRCRKVILKRTLSSQLQLCQTFLNLYPSLAQDTQRVLTNDICNTLWHRLLRDYLHHFEELFVNSCFNLAKRGAKAAPTPPTVGDEYSTYRRTLEHIRPYSHPVSYSKNNKL